MVLACDGIWNYLSSEEVVDFVRQRLKDDSKKLSQICEEVNSKNCVYIYYYSNCLTNFFLYPHYLKAF